MRLLCREIEYEKLLKGLTEFSPELEKQCRASYEPFDDQKKTDSIYYIPPYYVDIDVEPTEMQTLFKFVSARFDGLTLKEFHRKWNVFYENLNFYASLRDQLEMFAQSVEYGEQISRLEYIFRKVKILFPSYPWQKSFVGEENEECVQLNGESGISLLLYDDCGEFVLEVFPTATKNTGTHWHPQTTQEALNDLKNILNEKILFAFKRGTLRSLLSDADLERPLFKFFYRKHEIFSIKRKLER